MNSQRDLNNNFVLDGLSVNDDAAGLAGTFFSQEVIREFQVVTSGAIAEFGRASAGTINIVTQSGTNQVRGRGYGFFRNDGSTPGTRSRRPRIRFGTSSSARHSADRFGAMPPFVLLQPAAGRQRRPRGLGALG